MVADNKVTEAVIAKQQREIESLKDELAGCVASLQEIVLTCVCIGGPLNDNIKGYTRDQMVDFFRIVSLAESNDLRER